MCIPTHAHMHAEGHNTVYLHLLQAEDHNNAGEYNSARSCGSYALFCNIAAIVVYVLILLAAVGFAIAYFTGALDSLLKRAGTAGPAYSLGAAS